MGIKSSGVEMILLDRVSIPANQVIAALGKTRAAALGMTGVNRSAAQSAGFLGATLGKLGALAAGYFSINTIREGVQVHAEEAKQWQRIGWAAKASAAEVAAAHKETNEAAIATGIYQEELQKAAKVLVTGTGRSLDAATKLLPIIGGVANVTEASAENVAKVSDAMDRMLGMKGPQQQQRAFEMMNNAAQAGRVQIPEMTVGLAHLAETAARFGYTNEKGLGKLLSLIEAFSTRTADSAEALSQVEMVIGNMTSQRQAKRFEKMGVDIQGMLAKAAVAGTDQLEVVANAIWKAIGGKFENLPKLFPQNELQMAARNLLAVYGQLGGYFSKIMAQSDELARKQAEYAKGPGAAIENLRTSWHEFLDELGGLAHEAGVTAGLRALAETAKELATSLRDAKASIMWFTGQGPKPEAKGPKTSEEWQELYLDARGRLQRKSLETRLKTLRALREKTPERPPPGADTREQLDEKIAKIEQQLREGTPAEKEARQREQAKEREKFGYKPWYGKVPEYGPGEYPPTAPAPPLVYGPPPEAFFPEGRAEQAGAEAGAQAGQSFTSALKEKLGEAMQAIQPEIDRLKNALGFTATPTITPKVTPQSYEGGNKAVGRTIDARVRGLKSDWNPTIGA